ncbi:MAG: M23 family metallopeptidase, partial [Actinobacteria bacterium]|nr:M23 family metallopeptidase [Actinomycetota bacterium]
MDEQSKRNRHPVHVGSRTAFASVGAGLLAAMIALPAGAVVPSSTATLDPAVGIAVAAPAAAVPAKPLVSPVSKVKYSAHFGDGGGNWSSGKHTGLDFVVKEGTNVKAAASGTVVEAGSAGAYGNAITIKHDNGMKTMYAHLSKIKVTVGQQVSFGELIGKSGPTGNSTGPHLHFAVIVGQ